jgi:hypothetical protein
MACSVFSEVFHMDREALVMETDGAGGSGRAGETSGTRSILVKCRKIVFTVILFMIADAVVISINFHNTHSGVVSQRHVYRDPILNGGRSGDRHQFSQHLQD